MRKLFLTFFYTGFLPKAPGTWGSLAGVLTAFVIIKYLGMQTLFLSTILITLIAIKEIDQYEKTHSHDAKEIVIDEVAGVWLSICISNATDSFYLLLNFIFFRLFDIYKPSVIGKIDKNVKGGLGVMLDDLLAGVFSAICSGIVYMGYIKLQSF